MKRISIFMIGLALCAASPSRAQDAAIQQRLNELDGKIQNLLETQELQRKQIAQLMREFDNLQEQQNKPSPSYAGADDLKRLADAVREVDRKRLEDYEKIRAELLKLGRNLAASIPAAPKSRGKPATDEASTGPKTGFEYTIQSGDSLSAIAAAYREQNIKVNWEDIIKANPGLKPGKLPVGKKIFIPAPKP